MWTFNISETYVDKYYPLWSILAAAEFVIFSTTNMLKGHSPGQLVFFCDMIISIKHKVDWELIPQRKQTKNNKDNVCENNKRVDHYYKARDKCMLNSYSAYKYETPHKGFLMTTQHCTNGTVALQYFSTKMG